MLLCVCARWSNWEVVLNWPHSFFSTYSIGILIYNSENLTLNSLTLLIPTCIISPSIFPPPVSPLDDIAIIVLSVCVFFCTWILIHILVHFYFPFLFALFNHLCCLLKVSWRKRSLCFFIFCSLILNSLLI